MSDRQEEKDTPGKEKEEKESMQAPNKLEEDMVIMTELAVYRLDENSTERKFGGRTVKAERIYDRKIVRMEFESTEKDPKASHVALERLVQWTLKARGKSESLLRFLLTAQDSGHHDPWCFVVFPQNEQTITAYMNKYRNSDDYDPGVMLKMTVQMFLGIRDLHMGNIIHGNIRPENFVIGGKNSLQNRKILLKDFTSAATITGPSLTPIAPPDDTFISRARERKKAPTRKDDIESWLYVVAFLYHKNTIPWLAEKDNKNLPKDAPNRGKKQLLLKKGFCAGKLWSALREVVFEQFNKLIKEHLLVKGNQAPHYDEMWNILNGDCIKRELDPFSPFPWNGANSGQVVEYSKNALSPQDMKAQDFDN